jgi:hypothetical protein
VRRGVFAGLLACALVARLLGLDQIPEAVLLLLPYAGPLGIGLAEIAAVTAVFTLFDLIATPLRSGT